MLAGIPAVQATRMKMRNLLLDSEERPPWSPGATEPSWLVARAWCSVKAGLTKDEEQHGAEALSQPDIAE